MLEKAAGMPPNNSLTLEAIRRANIGLIPLLGRPEKIYKVEDREIPGPAGTIPVRLYWPETATPRPVVLCFHGGGMVAGSIAVFENVCRTLTNRADCICISVEYRLAPENKFPVPLEDCYAALAWAVRNAAEFGGDPARIAILGESAGANLAAGLALLARDRGGPALAFQVLIYPPLEYPVPGSPSMQELGKDYGLTQVDIQWCAEQYMQSEADRQNPYCLPLTAFNLGGLPPALVITAEYDPLRDEGETYAARLREAGVPATARRYPGVLHGFYLFTTLVEPARQALEDTVAALRAVLELKAGEGNL
jgi:acetyl esterase